MSRVLLKMTYSISKDSEGDTWLSSPFWDHPSPCPRCIRGNIPQLRENMEIIQSLGTELLKA